MCFIFTERPFLDMVCPCGIDLLEDRGSTVQCISGGVVTAGNAVSGFYLRCAATSLRSQLKPRGFSGETRYMILPIELPGKPDASRMPF